MPIDLFDVCGPKLLSPRMLQNKEGETKERCSEICRKSRLRCTSDKDHSGRHKFTPPDLLSPSTLTKLLLELTSGEIKSRAGLDNTDVKGMFTLDAVVLDVRDGIAPFQTAAQPSQSSRKVAAGRLQRLQFDLNTLESKQINLSVWWGFLEK